MPAEQNRYAIAYFEMFVLVTFLIWLPQMKQVAYVAPFIGLAYFIYRTRSGIVFYRLFAILTVYLVFCFLQYIIAIELFDWRMIPFNYLFSFVTYGSFVFLLVIPNRFIESGFDYEKYARFLSPFLFIQGCVGIFQFLIVQFTGAYDILEADSVQGTIGLFAFIREDAGFGNQMYTINICLLLIFFTPYVFIYKKGYLSFGVAIVSILLAVVVHVFLSLAVAMILILGYFYIKIFLRRLKTILLVLVSLTVGIVLFEVIFPGIGNSARIFYEYLVYEGNSPKNKAFNIALNEIPDEHPNVLILGMGAGQYASRSGLICSGKYFSRHIELLPNAISEPFEIYIDAVWKDYESRGAVYGASTMHRPFASWLSILIEFGIVISAILLIYLLKILYKCRSKYFQFLSEGKTVEQQLAMGIGVSAAFILLIGVWENYLETTQAIFYGMVLFKIAYAHLMKTHSSAAD